MKYTKPRATNLIDYNEKMDDKDKSIHISGEITPCLCVGGPDNLKKNRR